MKPTNQIQPNFVGPLWDRSDEDNTQHPHYLPAIPDVVLGRIKD